METYATVTRRALPRRWPWALALVVAVAVAAIVVFLLSRGGDESTQAHGPAAAPFTVTLPSGWESLSQQQLLALPGHPLAVLRQTDGNGIVVIHVESQTSAGLSQLSHKLEARLTKTIPDFELVNSRTVTVKAGRALSISYARTQQGTANTLLVVPTSKGLYNLNAVVPAGQEGAARDAASILSSFDA